MGKIMTFQEWQKAAPVREMFNRMGLANYLDSAQSWGTLRRLIVDFNDCDKGNFVKVARKLDGVASSGERILLHAVCYVCDFAWLADEFGTAKKESMVWRNMDRASGEHQKCVAACISAVVIW